MIDLHVHSLRSDGTMTPTELVDYAIEKGLSAMALTDHDTVAGISEAIGYAGKLKEEGITVPEIIPGIELSTDYYGQDVHIVGLYIDYTNPDFEDYLADFVNSREIRNVKVCKMLTDAGMPVDYDELRQKNEGAVITRAHFAAYLLEKGFVKSKKEAFDRYIGDGRPFHIPREKINPIDAVKMILKAKGIPVLAHPILYGFGKDKLDTLVASLKEEGLMGIEAVYSTYTLADERQIRELANKYHLLLSGGSDFHGTNKDGIDLAVGKGKLYVDDSLLDAIKASHKKVLFTDMDGTLLLNDSTVSPAMQSALKTATDNGHRVVLTSGRPLDSILEVKDKFGLNFKNMWIIANNGSVIYNCDKKEYIFKKKLPIDIVLKVMELCEEAGIHAHVYTDKDIVGTVEDEELAFYRSKIHLPFILTDDLRKTIPDGSFKVEIIALNDYPALVELRKVIEAKLGDVVDAVFSNTMYLEILPKGISKGNALLTLEKYLPVAHYNTYASGDAPNDLSMIEAAGVGVAMANAQQCVKDVADIVTKEDNNHNGLIEIIRSFD